MKKFFFILIFIPVLLFPMAASAQRPNQPPIQRPRSIDEDVVKISTTLIQVDATVLDKQGKIVTGLTADDFEIYENGRKRQITNLSFVELAPANVASSTDGKSRSKSTSDISVPNRTRHTEAHRTLALVIDDLGLAASSIDGLKHALDKFVDEQMQSGDLVAIVRTGRGAGALQQFTSDKRLLHAIIKRIRWNPGGRAGVTVFQPVSPDDAGAMKPNSAGIMDMVEGNKKFDALREDIFVAFYHIHDAR